MLYHLRWIECFIGYYLENEFWDNLNRAQSLIDLKRFISHVSSNMSKTGLRQLISTVFIKKPKLCFSFLRFVLKFGQKLDLNEALLNIRRPEWLMHDFLNEHRKETYFCAADPINSELISLASRILDSYLLAQQAGVSQGHTKDSLWGQIEQNYQFSLISILQENDHEKLARHLSNLFQQKSSNGYTHGSRWQEFPHRMLFVNSAIIERLVSFAEEIGVIRAENIEQGAIGYSLQEGISSILGKLEKFLDIKMDFPRVGGAYGLLFDETLITNESSRHIYGAYRIVKFLNEHSSLMEYPLNIVEIGGGFVGTAYWLHKFLKDKIASYTIVDLPTSNISQSYFLTHALPNIKIALFGESSDDAKISIIPHFSTEQLKNKKIHLVINQDSMPEMPSDEVERYIKWISTNPGCFFYSMNHEAFSIVNGKPQIYVPEIIQNFSNFQRLERNMMWVRRGYVEEIYQVR